VSLPGRPPGAIADVARGRDEEADDGDAADGREGDGDDACREQVDGREREDAGDERDERVQSREPPNVE